MNPERILIAAEAVGLQKLALSRAAEYAKARTSSAGQSARTRPFSIPCGKLGRARGGVADGDVRGLPIRQRDALRRRGRTPPNILLEKLASGRASRPS